MTPKFWSCRAQPNMRQGGSTIGSSAKLTPICGNASMSTPEYLNLAPKRIVVRDQSTRWGSCSSAGALSFSWRLILAPSFVLDYLAAHEVAHLAEMNHGPRFWKLVERAMPRHQEARAWLRQHGANLHRYGA